VVIADQHVADLHLARILEAVPGAFVLTFPQGEASKSLDTAGRLCDQLAEARVGREALICAFGGGVAGDLAGFVAGTWLRGVGFVQVPTTLLAAVDASVGGKTGVNVPAGKNLVGVFHQPEAVFIDTDLLRTLPARDLAAGLAESVKHALIRAGDFFAWHEEHAEGLVGSTPEELTWLIARNCEIKAAVVAQDEREADLRAILNFGHTIGHALEHELEYELRHGECVGLGMLVENEIAVARRMLDPTLADRTKALLQRLGLPTHLPRAVADEAVLAACRVDKKVRAGVIRFVLLHSLGDPVIVGDVSDAEIVSALRLIRPPA
jgi:3-dehydroquinate synthase